MKISYKDLPKPRGKEIRIIALADIILVFGWLSAQVSGQSKWTNSLAVLVVGVTIGFVTYLSILDRAEKKALYTFFAENAARNLTDDEMWGIIPPCFGQLADRQDVVSVSVRDGYMFPLTTKLYNKTFLFEYVIEHDDRQYAYLFTISAIKQERLFPHMFLDGKRNGANYVYGSTQIQQLEGEFNKHFTLYVPEKSKVDALTVLTPDVMQKIIHDARPYDLEFKGNNIAFIAKGSQYDRTKLPLLFGVQKRLEAELNDGASGSGSLDIQAALNSQLKPWELTTPQWIALSVAGLAVAVALFFI